MRQSIVVGANAFVFEAIEGELKLNGVAVTSRELRALGEMIHHARICADLQHSAKRLRARSVGGGS